MKKSLFALVMGAVVLAFAACNPGGEEVKSLSLDKTAVTLAVGKTAQLVANVDPADAVLAWTSSDATVATVENGLVTAVAEGTCKIKVAAGNKSAICDVTVGTQGGGNEGGMPEVAPTDGAVTLVWNIANPDWEDCNSGLCFLGDYNGWSTDNDVATFEALGNNWYKAVIIPSDAPSSETAVLAGKCCGKNAWDYQWFPHHETDEYPNACEVVAGPAVIEEENSNEPKLFVTENSSVVYVRSYAFKANPCKIEYLDKITFNVTVPASVDSLYIKGGFNGWGEIAMEKKADGQFTYTWNEQATLNVEYGVYVKDTADHWMAAKGAAGDCWVGISNFKADDVEVYPEVETFQNWGETPAQCE